MLRESRQQKRPSDSWRKNTEEGVPTAKSLVQICTSASLSAEWKHTSWHSGGSKTTQLKLDAAFHPTVYVCFFNDWLSNTSCLNKFSSPRRCEIQQLWFYFYFFFWVYCFFGMFFQLDFHFYFFLPLLWPFALVFLLLLLFSLRGMYIFFLVNTMCTSLFILFLLQLVFVLKKQSLPA